MDEMEALREQAKREAAEMRDEIDVWVKARRRERLVAWFGFGGGILAFVLAVLAAGMALGDGQYIATVKYLILAAVATFVVGTVKA